MKKMYNKTKISIISLILMLALTPLIFAFPITLAQEPLRKKTYPIIGATPNPVGINQEVLLHVGITDVAYWPQSGWKGLTVEVSRPDGQTETLGPFNTDTTGGTGTIYIPTLVGTYTLQTHFPEQTVEAVAAGRGFPIGTIMEAGESRELELIVTQEQREYYPSTPLPDEYWTRPINAQYREWTTISGSWLERPMNQYAPYNEGPDSGHILWTKTYAEGGLVGGDLGNHSFETGDAYEGKWADPVIIAGILISNRYARDGPGTQYQPDEPQEAFAINLRTGEELWSKTLGDNLLIEFGQIMYWNTFNMHGAFAYVWARDGSTWYAFDPLTGRWEFTLENVPGGSRIHGSNGEILLYSVNLGAGQMSMWNSTRAVHEQFLEDFAGDELTEYNAGRWRPMGRTFDATKGIQWTVSIPTDLPGGVRLTLEDRVIGSNYRRDREPDYDYQNAVNWAISTKPGEEGTLLYNTTWQPQEGFIQLEMGTASLEEGVFVVRAKEITGYYGFDIDTGEYMWGPTDPQYYLDAFTDGGFFGTGGLIAYGKLFTGTTSGILYCHDVHTGQFLWKYEVADEFTEILWSNNWNIQTFALADGKVYAAHTEHSVVNPMPRGAPLVAIDVESGEKAFSINLRTTRWGSAPIIGDSVIAIMNTYDNQLFAIGKGPSSITLETSLEAIPKGSGVNIKGRVTDVSPGTEDNKVKARFPTGVPAIADEFMSDWMEYVFMQSSRPADAVGVPVKIQIVDPSGVYAWIGTATSDSYGNYAFPFAPDMEGQYTIIATFDGSDSYYGCQATDYLLVGPSATPSGPITPENPVVPLISTEAAIIIVVSIATIIGLVSFAIMRRRK